MSSRDPPHARRRIALVKFEERSLEHVLEYSKRADTRWDYDQLVFMVPLVESAYPRDPPLLTRRRKRAYRAELDLIRIRLWELDAGQLLKHRHPVFGTRTWKGSTR